jgi:hypothetical protein
LSTSKATLSAPSTKVDGCCGLEGWQSIPPVSSKDFWRFTPEALALLHRDFSEVIDAGGWGNFSVWSLVRDGMRHVGVPHAAWHPMHWIATKNDPRWPIVTWVVARK